MKQQSIRTLKRYCSLLIPRKLREIYTKQYNSNILIHELIHQPFVQGIETTNHCISHCSICPHDRMKREKGYISFDTFKVAIDNILNYSSDKVITLHHFGDPLLHKNIVEFIDYAESNGIRTTFSTIGHLLTKDIATNIINSKLSVIKFSFWGTTNEQFSEIQKVSFHDTLNNINYFLQNNQKIKVVIDLLTDGSHKLENFPDHETWKDKTYMQTTKIGNWTGDDEIVNITTKQNPSIITQLPCQKLWKCQLKILWNGDVVPCCMDYDGKAIIGNILQNNLLEIWHGSKIETMRKLHLHGRRCDIPLCRKCNAVMWNKSIEKDLQNVFRLTNKP